MRRKHLATPPRRGRAWNGARAWRAEALLRHENERLGRGISYDELTAAWQARYGEKERSGSAMLEAGVWRGVVLVDELSSRTIRVRHAAVDVPFWLEHDLPVALRRLLHEWFAREQSPISARRLTDLVTEAGIALPYPGAVPALLHSLATGDVAREQAGKYFTCLEVGLTTDRFSKRWLGYVPNTPDGVTWLETCLGEPLTSVRASVPLAQLLWPRDHHEAKRLAPLVQMLPRATAARVAVARAQAHFREPVEVSRLRLWIAEQPDHDTTWRELRRDTIRAAVAESARRDAETAAEGQAAADHCQIFEHPLTGWGRCAPRYYVGPLSPLDEGVVLAEDIADYFRLADEAQGEQVIGQQPWLRRELRAQLVATRRAAVAAALRRYLPAPHLAALGALAGEAATRAAAVTAQYQASGKFGKSSHHHTTGARRTLQHIQALPGFLPVASEGPLHRLIGDADASVDLDALERMLAAGVELRGQRNPRGTNLLRDARRTPAREVARDHEAYAYPRIDRVDGIAAIISCLPITRANALVSSATLLLGTVLRDPAPIRALLAALGPADHTARRAAIVALGLLGDSVDWEVAAVSQGDSLGAATWAFSAVAGTLTAEGALPLVQQAARLTKGAARQTLTEAAIQLRAGRLLNVVG